VHEAHNCAVKTEHGDELSEVWKSRRCCVAHMDDSKLLGRCCAAAEEGMRKNEGAMRDIRVLKKKPFTTIVM